MMVRIQLHPGLTRIDILRALEDAEDVISRLPRWPTGRTEIPLKGENDRTVGVLYLN